MPGPDFGGRVPVNFDGPGRLHWDGRQLPSVASTTTPVTCQPSRP